MKLIPPILAALLLALLAALQAADVKQPTTKPWVTLGDDKNLRYQTTSNPPTNGLRALRTPR